MWLYASAAKFYVICALICRCYYDVPEVPQASSEEGDLLLRRF